MPSQIASIAAYAVATSQLLGTWVADAAAFGAHPSPVAAPTMTVTRDAISFGSGRREVGVAPISTVEVQPGDALLVRTRLGDVYRFRFTGPDRVCRIDDIAGPRAAPARSECFSRSRDKV